MQNDCNLSVPSPVSHDSLINLRIAKWKKRIMVGFGLFLGKFELIVNSKSELCYTCPIPKIYVQQTLVYGAKFMHDWIEFKAHQS